MATQKEKQDYVCELLHDAQHKVAIASQGIGELDRDQNFISLAKVVADNIATMIGNLENRIKFPLKSNPSDRFDIPG